MTKNKIKLVIFDMDGTLTKPYLDFAVIRKAVGVPDDSMLTLDYIVTIKDPEEKQKAMNILIDYENKAAFEAELQEGVHETIEKLHEQNILTAVQTRNSLRSVEIVFNKFGLHFDDIFTRENAPPKPDPAAVNSLLSKYSILPEQAVFVGDFWPDIETGKNAGIRTVMIYNGIDNSKGLDPDKWIKTMPELLEALEQW